MVVRRNDSRRRRVGVVTEPAVSADTSTDAPAPAPDKRAKNARPYSYGADRRSQMKTTDLIPKRMLSVSLVVLVMIAAIGLLNLLSAFAGSWQNNIGSAGADSLSLVGRGTLSSWFQSLLLIVTGLASLQIYALRQHRRDDYRGTYRLWIWMAGLFLLASINCVIDLTVIATNLLNSLSTISMRAKPWVPVAVKLILLATLIARGLYEIRASRGAFALVVFVWVAYSAAAVMQLPEVRPVMVDLGHDSTIGNCMLFATASLLLSLLTYGRFVYLRAHGLIKIKPAKVKTAKVKSVKSKTKPKSKTKTKTKPNESADTDSQEAATSTKRIKKTKTKSTPAVTTEPKTRKTKTSKPAVRVVRPDPAVVQEIEPDDEEFEGVIKMSKSERRRRRKEEKRRNRAA